MTDKKRLCVGYRIQTVAGVKPYCPQWGPPNVWDSVVDTLHVLHITGWEGMKRVSCCLHLMIVLRLTYTVATSLYTLGTVRQVYHGMWVGKTGAWMHLVSSGSIVIHTRIVQSTLCVEEVEGIVWACRHTRASTYQLVWKSVIPYGFWTRPGSLVQSAQERIPAAGGPTLFNCLEKFHGWRAHPKSGSEG